MSSPETGPGEDTTYYGRPVLKEPVWEWYVPAYFWLGGVAGASALLGAAAQLAGGVGMRGLVVRCRLLALAAISLGTVALVADLGRPRRFLNMLRVFRPTSPMSVGSWLLAGFGPAAGGAAVLAGAGGGWRGVADVSGLAAGGLGVPLVGYTAVLLGATAVPAWQEARTSLPVVFAGSAVASAASVLDLVPMGPAERRVVEGFGMAGRALDLAGSLALGREVAGVEEVGRPYRQGLSGALWKAGEAAVAASLVLTLLGRRRRGRRGTPGWARVAAGLTGTVGTVLTRVAVFEAGRASARDPRATFRLQRAGG